MILAQSSMRGVCSRCACNVIKRRRTRCSSDVARFNSTLSSPTPLKLAVIGAGPSGFYTASRILSSISQDDARGRDVEVHMYERLPTPYGLVRYGVAPDHPEVKNCQHKFDELAKDPRFKYFGNTLITSQPSVPSSTPTSSTSIDQPSTALSSYTYPHAARIPLSSILSNYNALLLSYGASLSNPLHSVSGSSSSPTPLTNVIPALALVGWYNSHPAYADLPINLKGIEEVSIIGQGNVALDVARILLKPVYDLRHTDLHEEVLETLSESSVRNVKVVGRRGPGQVSFTTKEFREMINIPNVSYPGLSDHLVEEARGSVNGDRMRTRLLGLMENPNKHHSPSSFTPSSGKAFSLEFLRSPVAFIPDSTGPSGRVKEVEWAVNELLPAVSSIPAPPASQESAIPQQSATGVIAKPTGEKVKERADMVIESVGYRSETLEEPGKGWDLPFDTVKGRVRNIGGRVVSDDGIVIPGIYAAGWVARGPVGVIASTMHDAYSIADQILFDHYPDHSSSSSSSTASSYPSSPPTPSNGSGPMRAQTTIGELPEEVRRGLKEGKVVDLEGWEKIDKAERERGRKYGKEREKFRRVEEMLDVLS